MAKLNLPDFELRVLQQLWEHGAQTARQLTDRMYPQGSHSSYMTVKKLLERLEAKGFVQRSADERLHRFIAVMDRETLVANELEGVVERLCDGSIAPLVNALVQRIDLDAAQRNELEQLISDYQAKVARREQQP